MEANQSTARARAEALFKKEEQMREGAKATLTEYKAVQQAIRENTARLRALRLARDAANRVPQTSDACGGNRCPAVFGR